MPRRSKNQQAPQAAPGQAYGESTDQIQAQNVIPLPQQAPPSAGGAPPGTSPPGPGAPPVAGGNPMAAALAAAQASAPPQGSLAAPSMRPGEPVTAGLPIGAGPGPEVLGPSKARASLVADTYKMLYELTGDTRYQTMATIAMQQGV